MADSSLKERVSNKARELGFDAVAFARADAPLDADYERYRAFLAEGMHGSMRFLAENERVRRSLDGPDILPGAKTVVCLARRYRRDDSGDPPLARMVARYARGHDYHNGVRKKLRRLAAFVRALGEGVAARPLCDEEPVLERAWAARAGLGFVGKNGLLIVPGQGSMVLLGEVVTTLALEPDSPIPERCGACTLCIDACPTRALVRPFVLDARRCVAYLTIEHEGDVDPARAPAIGERLFGCDDCQTACPFNQGRMAPARTAMFEPLERWSTISLEDLLDPALEARWAEVAEGSPLHRAGPESLARNAALVLRNRGERSPALERAARSHPSAVVRRAAGGS